MRFLCKQECRDWLQKERLVLPGDEMHVLSLDTNVQVSASHAFAHTIADILCSPHESLLWITEWSIWPSSENWFLYNRLRQSYGNHQELHQEPGHLFLPDEIEDAATFLQLAIGNGWGGYVLSPKSALAFFSHDEYIRFYGEHPEQVELIRKLLA